MQIISRAHAHAQGLYALAGRVIRSASQVTNRQRTLALKIRFGLIVTRYCCLACRNGDPSGACPSLLINARNVYTYLHVSSRSILATNAFCLAEAGERVKCWTQASQTQAMDYASIATSHLSCMSIYGVCKLQHAQKHSALFAGHSMGTASKHKMSRKHFERLKKNLFKLRIWSLIGYAIIYLDTSVQGESYFRLPTTSAQSSRSLYWSLVHFICYDTACTIQSP